MGTLCVQGPGAGVLPEGRGARWSVGKPCGFWLREEVGPASAPGVGSSEVVPCELGWAVHPAILASFPSVNLGLCATVFPEPRSAAKESRMPPKVGGGCVCDSDVSLSPTVYWAWSEE